MITKKEACELKRVVASLGAYEVDIDVMIREAIVSGVEHVSYPVPSQHIAELLAARYRAADWINAKAADLGSDRAQSYTIAWHVVLEMP